jgi:hypothetical protein
MNRLVTVEGSLLARGVEHGGAYVRSRLQIVRNECRHCRECEQQISPFESVCSHCGASSPAAVSPASVAFLAGGICLAVVVLAVVLF